MATRSLGTLTLDLVAKTGGYVGGLTKAERESEKWRRKVKSQVEDVVKTFATVGAAAGVGLAALTAKTVQSAKEIERLSRVSNTTAENFQRYSAGARAFGIEQEKLADIFKDTSDKVGDFLQTGGGPLADFFENVAPLVGVTAEQFRNLSGPQALELYVSSLEKANVSQNDMTFYLEAIASDATLLYPLLRDNAAGFREFGDEAERAGAIMSRDTLQAANELSASLFLAEQAASGIKNQVAQELLPVLADFSEMLFDVSVQGEAAATVGQGIGDSMKFIAQAGVGAAAAFDLVGKSIGGYYAILSSAADIDISNALNPFRDEQGDQKLAEDVDRVKNAIAIVKTDLQETALEYAQILDRIDNAGTDFEEDTESRVKSLAKRLANDREALSGSLSGGPSFKNTTDNDDAQKEIDRINRQAESIRQSLLSEEDAIKESYERRREIILKNTEITGKARQTLLDRLEQEREEALANTSDQQAIERINQQAEAIANGLMAEEDQIRASYERRRNIILEATQYTEEERTELLKQLEADRQTQLLELEGIRATNLLTNQEQLFGGLASLAKQFAGEQSGIYQVLFAAEKAAAIARSIVAIQTGIAQAASTPFPANLAAMAAVAAQTAGIISTIQGTSFEGGGWTGNGPRSGGLDGKGGYMAMIHPQEMIIDHAGSPVSGGGKSLTLNQYINVAPSTDNRTAHQIANESARRQRLAQARFSS